MIDIDRRTLGAALIVALIVAASAGSFAAGPANIAGDYQINGKPAVWTPTTATIECEAQPEQTKQVLDLTDLDYASNGIFGDVQQAEHVYAPRALNAPSVSMSINVDNFGGIGANDELIIERKDPGSDSWEPVTTITLQSWWQENPQETVFARNVWTDANFRHNGTPTQIRITTNMAGSTMDSLEQGDVTFSMRYQPFALETIGDSVSIPTQRGTCDVSQLSEQLGAGYQYGGYVRNGQYQSNVRSGTLMFGQSIEVITGLELATNQKAAVDRNGDDVLDTYLLSEQKGGWTYYPIKQSGTVGGSTGVYYTDTSDGRQLLPPSTFVCHPASPECSDDGQRRLEDPELTDVSSGYYLVGDGRACRYIDGDKQCTSVPQSCPSGEWVNPDTMQCDALPGQLQQISSDGIDDSGGGSLMWVLLAAVLGFIVALVIALFVVAIAP